MLENQDPYRLTRTSSTCMSAAKPAPVGAGREWVRDAVQGSAAAFTTTGPDCRQLGTVNG